MKLSIDQKEISVGGKFFKIAKLRHEWCDFLKDPPAAIEHLRQGRRVADVFTFVCDLCDKRPDYPFRTEITSVSVLPVKTYDEWWTGLDFKVRNKVRKAYKSGVELRMVELNDDFAKGVEAIYNESPLRQGRKFFHYGKKCGAIKEELSSFLDRSTLVGAYYQDELIGFVKLFQGNNVLRTIHIISKMSHREKPVMDALLAKSVELCGERKIEHLHYGSWTEGGVGVFRVKHGFVRVDLPRYFVPMTLRGTLMLKMNLHRPIRDRLPKSWIDPMIGLRTKWNSLRFGRSKSLVQG
jgi:hypothetical protein